MAQQSTREKLLQAARRLLEEGVPPDELTTRRLTAEAGVNLSMINYCFHSKDALLKAAVDEIVAAEFRRHARRGPPRQHPSATAPRPPPARLPGHAQIPRFDPGLHPLPSAGRTHLASPGYSARPPGPFRPRQIGRGLPAGRLRPGLYHALAFYRGEEFQRYYGPEIYSDAGAAAFLDAQLDLFLGGE